MKKLKMIAALALTSCFALYGQLASASIGNTVTPRSRSVAILHQHFPSAQNVSWHADKRSITAFYRIRGEKAITNFDTNGKLLFTLIYRKTNELPISIYEKLSGKYKGFKITNVEEYLADNTHFYSILMESKTQLVSLRVANANNIRLLQKLNKT
jgi:hypothetical protein